MSSSDSNELENGSEENDAGLVGVKGKSSDMSDIVLVALIGVLVPDSKADRFGVVGKLTICCC